MGEPRILTELDEAELEDRIEQWHSGDGAGQALHDYLGMTRQEYARWVEGPSTKG